MFERPERDAQQGAVDDARRGDIKAFEPLVKATAPRVIRLAYHFLGDWDEARDLSQETYARAFRHLDRYDPSQPFEAWVFTIAARLATDRLRRRRTRAAATESLMSLAREQPPAADPVAELSLKEALGRLTARQREAVVLCDLHGFSATEAAAMIGCAASTVRVQRFLARRRLRLLLQPAASSEGSLDVSGARTEGPVAAEARR